MLLASLVIRLTPDNLKGPVNLFQQNQAHQLVGESHGGKAEQKVGLGEQAGASPKEPPMRKVRRFALPMSGCLFFRQPFELSIFLPANALGSRL